MSSSWRTRAAESWRAYIAGHITEARHRKPHKHPPFAAHLGQILGLRRSSCNLCAHELNRSAWRVRRTA